MPLGAFVQTPRTFNQGKSMSQNRGSPHLAAPCYWPGTSHLAYLVLVFLIHEMGMSCLNFVQLLVIWGK